MINNINRYENQEIITANQNTRGFQLVHHAYTITKRYQADYLVFTMNLDESDVPVIINEMEIAGIKQFALAVDCSNMYGTYEILQNAGFKMQGITTIPTHDKRDKDFTIKALVFKK